MFNILNKALVKTIDNIKTIVPQKKEKIEFDIIEEMLIEADMDYDIIQKAMDGLPSLITKDQLRHRLIMLFEHASNINTSNLSKTPLWKL